MKDLLTLAGILALVAWALQSASSGSAVVILPVGAERISGMPPSNRPPMTDRPNPPHLIQRRPVY